MTTIAPIHPGDILMAEFLEPRISHNRLAVAISVPPRGIDEIVHGKRRITADTALRLARYFGDTDRFWLDLPTRFHLEVEKGHLGEASTASSRSRPSEPAGCSRSRVPWRSRRRTAPGPPEPAG